MTVHVTKSDTPHDVGARGATSAQGRTAPRAIPQQRSASPRPQVRTFWDGSRWTYRIVGEPDLGHRFSEPAQALAAGRYLARTMRAELVVENEDGSLRERTDYGAECGCHPRGGARD